MPLYIVDFIHRINAKLLCIHTSRVSTLLDVMIAFFLYLGIGHDRLRTHPRLTSVKNRAVTYTNTRVYMYTFIGYDSYSRIHASIEKRQRETRKDTSDSCFREKRMREKGKDIVQDAL